MIGCGCLAALVLIAGAGLLLVPRGVWDLAGIGKALIAAHAERDRLFAEALANGDAAAAYERADERFRKAYTADQLAAYFRDQPALFDPLPGSASLSSGTTNGRTVVSTTFEAGQRKYSIYAAKDGEGMHLLGISPALDRAAPSANSEPKGPGTEASPKEAVPKEAIPNAAPR
jgi:hypothetical protein